MTTLDEIRRKLAAWNNTGINPIQDEMFDTRYAAEDTMYKELEANYITSKLKTGYKCAINEKQPIDLNYDHSLVCPTCDNKDDSYLHHTGVEIFCRKEDSLDGEHIIIGGAPDMIDPNIMIDTNMDQNPSTRCTGIAIHFQCECCGQKHTLNFAQHKGHTLTGWSV